MKDKNTHIHTLTLNIGTLAPLTLSQRLARWHKDWHRHTSTQEHRQRQNRKELPNLSLWPETERKEPIQ